MKFHPKFTFIFRRFIQVFKQIFIADFDKNKGQNI